MSAIANAAAAVAAACCILPTSASAGLIERPFGASFTSLGDDPTVDWIHDPNGFYHGRIRGIDSAGAPTMMVNFDGDAELDALGDLEATMNIQGYYHTYLRKQLTAVQIELIYAGDDAFTVGGVNYTKGTKLISFGILDYGYDFAVLGPHSYGFTGPSTGIAGFASSPTGFGAILWEEKPRKVPDPNVAGRQYIPSGQGRWSGFITGNFVPEPSTWLLMILGFGATGSLLRRQGRTRTI